ncbi:allantoate amidohydrolase [Jatrophihabitans sp. DSM 45814]
MSTPTEPSVAASSFDRLWSAIEPIGRSAQTGGYRRFAWTAEDAALREWFAAESASRSLDLTTDRAGNQWAWWGDPDEGVDLGRPGVVVGSHLDSVPDGGPFDGPLGVISAFAALDDLRARGFTPAHPIGVVNFIDEEGARFGIACAGSRIITGALDADRARALTDNEGVSMAEAMTRVGATPSALGRDEETLRRVGAFVELHVEQGRGLIDLQSPVGVGTAIWPHGRWRFDLPGTANHAGTTALTDRNDPMLALADVLVQTRTMAERFDVLGTCGKLHVEPNGVNAIPSSVTGWLDARGADPGYVQAFVESLDDVVTRFGGSMRQESWTDETMLDLALAERLSVLLGNSPMMPTGAGHDAGILANAGVPTAMLFVRNPTGVSHSPLEHAERSDCLAGVDALAAAIAELSQ